ncbi:hypothetical protein ACFX13_000160 [Malus domestica]
MGPITSKSFVGEAYILTTTDYFSKWAEVVPLRKSRKKLSSVSSRSISSTNMVCLNTSSPTTKNSSPTDSCTSSARNTNLSSTSLPCIMLLKKVVGQTKRDWHERISEELWAYRMTHKTPTQATPYSLVYGVEAVMLLESQIASPRIVIQEDFTAKENAKL